MKLDDVFLSHQGDLVHWPRWKNTQAPRMLCLTIFSGAKDSPPSDHLNSPIWGRILWPPCTREAAYLTFITRRHLPRTQDKDQIKWKIKENLEKNPSTQELGERDRFKQQGKGKKKCLRKSYEPTKPLQVLKEKNIKKRGGRPTWGHPRELEHRLCVLLCLHSSLWAKIFATMIRETYLYSSRWLTLKSRFCQIPTDDPLLA